MKDKCPAKESRDADDSLQFVAPVAAAEDPLSELYLQLLVSSTRWKPAFTRVTGKRSGWREMVEQSFTAN